MAHEFDFILMDIHLPDIDGRELTKKLREKAQYKSIPIIAISADAMKKNIESSENLFDAYVTKPVSIQQILGALKKYLV